MEKIKILGIAPYQEMGLLMTDIARSYENVELYTFTGFYQNAIQFTKAFPDKEFDVVISRGGTATLLREMIDTPVIDVKVSVFDLLRVLKQALEYSENAAVVSYRYITSQVEMLAEFLRINIRTFSFDRPDQIAQTVADSCAQGVDLVIGGAATRDAAIANGAQFMLITSSRESVEASIRKAIEHHNLIRSALDNNQLFQSMVDKSSTAIFLFDGDAGIRYANIAARQLLNDVERLEHFLTGQLPLLRQSGSLHLIKRFNEKFYQLQGSTLTIGKQPHFLLELHFHSAAYRLAPFAEVENPEELQERRQLLGCNGLYLRPLLKTIETAGSSVLPVLIQGATGSRKGLVARYIHTKSAPAASFLRVRCGDVTEKTWKLLLGNTVSPLHGTGYTVYFENVCALSESLQQQIAAYIEDTKLSRRHRLISSSSCDLSTEVAQGRFSSKLYLQLSGLTVNIPALAQRREDLPGFVNLMLQQYNITYAKSVVGLEPDAMELLVKFDWPLNLLQLEKVLRQLVATTSSVYISAEEVSAVLSNESRKTVPVQDTLDLTGTLDEIERRIITRVLREENMNQSAAAKRLGIGRSTLWRKLGDGN